jgi:autotransporter-associated beta strand protein
MKSYRNIQNSPVRSLTLRLAIAGLIVPVATHAVTYEWTGATNNNLSGTSANWSPSLSSLGTGDVLRWNASAYTGTAPTANAAITFGELLFDAGNTNGITFGAGANALTLNGVSGTGILVNSGSGAVSTGSATFKLGAAQSWINNSSNTLTVGGGITNQGFLLTLDGTGVTTLGGIISGTGGVSVSNGTVKLNGANTFSTGGVALSGGTLVVGNAKSLGNAGAFTITGGTLDTISAGITLSTVGAQAWNGDFSFAGTGALNLSTAGVTLGGNRTVTVNASTLSVGGVINDGGNARSLTKAGGGALTLTGANTFTGGVTLSAGTVNINAVGVASTSGPLGNGGTFTINGGTINNTSSSAKVLANVNPITVGGNFSFSTSGGTTLNNLTLPGAVTLTGNRTVTTNGSGVFTLPGAIGDGGNGYSLTKDGVGTLTLTGANTFSGGFNILNGLVSFGNTTVGNYAHFGSGIVTLGDSSGSNSATLYDSIATSGNTYANPLVVAAGTSGNTLAIAGINSAITFTNTVALNNNLTLANGNIGKAITFSGLLTETSIGSPALTITNGATISGTAATAALTGQAIFSGGVVVGTGGITFANNSGSLFSVGTGNITSTTTGNLTFNANSTGAFTVSAASINHAGTITNSGTSTGATTISGAIGSNVTGLTQNSATSKLILTAANSSFIGDTSLTSGTLQLQNTNSLQSSVLNMNGGSVAFGTSTTVGLTSVALGGLSGIGNINLNNFLTVPTATNLTIGNSNAAYAGNTLNPSYSGNLSNTNGAASLTKVGSNTQTLSGVNTYSGATTISGGKLIIAGTGSINNTSGITIGAGEFVYNSTTPLTQAISFSGAGGALSGSGVIASALTVNAGNTLSPGNSPGVLSTGSQTWNGGGNYNWQVVDANGALGVGYDSVNITGGLDLSSLSLGNTFNINLWSLSGTAPDTNGNAVNFLNTSSYSWTLVSTSLGITGFASSLFTINTDAANGTSGFANMLGSGVFSVEMSGNDLNLVFTGSAIPEPSSYATLCGAIALVGALVYRRRRSK